jgi:hypothetical protein
MLFTFTSLIDFLGMCVSLWLALYLLGRSYPSRITLRGVLVLMALAVFFLGAYVNLYIQIPGTAAVRAVLLTVALSVWNDLTHKLLPVRIQRRLGVPVDMIYAFGLITIVLLLGTRDAFVSEVGNVLWVARMGIHPPYLIYGALQLIACGSILNNLRVGAKLGAGLQNRFFFIASVLAVATVGYGVLALALTPPMPRLIQDALILGSITVLGFSVARYQTLVERRTTLQDFPISALAVFGLSSIYTWLAWQFGLSPIAVILVTATAVLTHSIYNLAREFLDRLRSRDENAFRRQLRRLESDVRKDSSLQERLQSGLALLSQTVGAAGGFIAVRQPTGLVVLASHHSIPTGSPLSIQDEDCREICQPPTAFGIRAAWLAPAIQDGILTAVIGIGQPRHRLKYSEDDLDLLAETADRVGMLVDLDGRKPVNKDRLVQMVTDVQSYEADLQARSDELITSLASNPDPGFVKLVEDGLRNLSDFITLGESPLPGYLGAVGGTHIEKGKAVQQRLVRAIDALKPAGTLPGGSVPREWYSYIVLHEAYWQGVSNRDIMSKLYISEGTFNRTRRAAIRSVARALHEMAPSA